MTRDAEVLVIGGGVAGLCAAIAARRRGVSVQLLESAPQALRGGDARHARNFRIPHGAPTAHTPGVYTPAEFLAELKAVAGVESALAPSLIEDAADLAGWLQGCGVRLQRTEEGLLPYSRRTAFLYGGGKTMINALYRAAEEAGVAVRYDARALRLREGWLTEWERSPSRPNRPAAVDPAKAATQGEDDVQPLLDPRFREDDRFGSSRSGSAPAGPSLRAGAVVVASGGPGGDLAFLRDNLGDRADGLMIRGGAFSDGAMLRELVEAHGVATVGDPGSCHMVAVDARGPPVDGGIVTRVTAIPYGVVIDRDGAPLVDARHNAQRTHYAEWGPRIADVPGGVAFLILDAEGLARADPMALAPVPAETLPELAPALAGSALAALKPPLFVVPMRAGVTFAHYGVKVDGAMRMIGRKEAAIPGLYAAGMIMAANILPKGYLAGLGLTLSAVAGRRAGEAAARYVRG